MTADLHQSRRSVFVSYSHADRRMLERLRTHIKPLQWQGLCDFWDDTRIQAGTDWRREIGSAIEEASVALLLISADWVASQFIADEELPSLLAQARSRGLVVVPVVLSACRFDGALRWLLAIEEAFAK